jgi:hypothetical protein
MKEETKILRPNRLKTIVLLLICIFFVILGIFTIEQNSFRALYGILFFSLCMIVFILQLIPNSSYLKLTRNQFEIRSLFKSSYTKWSDVEIFRTGYIRNSEMVMFDFSKEHKKHNIGKNIAKFLTSNEGALPNTYGMKAKDLAELMNKWKSASKNL